MTIQEVAEKIKALPDMEKLALVDQILIQLDRPDPEIDHVIHRIKQDPNSCSELAAGLRRPLVSRFPYCLIYGLDGNTLVIVAVAHFHRKPSYWADRIL